MATEFPRKYCFSIANLRAVKFIAIASMVLRALAIASYIYGLIFINDNHTVSLLMEITIGVYAIYMIFDVLLYIGSSKMSKPLLIFWLFWAGIMVGLCITAIVFQLGSISGIFMAIISILLQIWAIFTVSGAVKEIDTFNRIGVTLENKV